jgi:hypothetical protein
MATLLEDLETYIIAQGQATADGVDIFRDFSPDTPDDVVVLNEYDSIPGNKGDDSVVRMVQVVSRSVSATTAKTKANSLFQLFFKQNESVTDFTATRWAIVTPRQSPSKIGLDEINRVLYAFNVGITTFID